EEFFTKWSTLEQFCTPRGLGSFVEYFQSQYVTRWALWSAAGDVGPSDWGATTNNLLEVRPALLARWLVCPSCTCGSCALRCVVVERAETEPHAEAVVP